MSVGFLALTSVAMWGLVAIVVARVIVLREARHPLEPLSRPCGRVEVAVLRAHVRRGSPMLAAMDALGVLRDAGAIDAAQDGTLTVVGPLPDGASTIDRLVYAAAGRGSTWDALLEDAEINTVTVAVEGDLRRAGLLSNIPERLAVRAGFVTAASILGATVVVSIAHGFSFSQWWGVCCTSLLGLVPAYGIVARTPWRTRAGDRALRRLAGTVTLQDVLEMREVDRGFVDRARLPIPVPPDD
jgi:uncharacterized protein (TIGR04222 family)